jgi:hypothetical protein
MFYSYFYNLFGLFAIGTEAQELFTGNSFSELIVNIHVEHAWFIVGQSTDTNVARCEYLRLRAMTLNIFNMYFSETFYSNNNNNNNK